MQDEKIIEDLKLSLENLRVDFLRKLRDLLSKTLHPDARRVVEKYIQEIENNPWV